MAHKMLGFLFFVSLNWCTTANPALEVGSEAGFTKYPGFALRHPNPLFYPDLEMRNVLRARQEANECGCQDGQKCCMTDTEHQFCVPENATCCGRTWCDGELEICCRDGPHGGCCPRDALCAIGGKGCCKKDRPCFGPYKCYDNGAKECTKGEVQDFQCCPGNTPFCLWDPENGYGCYPSKELPTYPPDPVPVVTPTTEAGPTSTALETGGTGVANPTSSSGDNSITETLTAEPTKNPTETDDGGAASTVVETVTSSGTSLIEPTDGAGSSVDSSSSRTRTTTGRTTTTNSSIASEFTGAAQTMTPEHELAKKFLAAGLAIMVLA